MVIKFDKTGVCYFDHKMKHRHQEKLYVYGNCVTHVTDVKRCAQL